MILLTQTIISKHPKIKNKEKCQILFENPFFVSRLPQVWQLLENLPDNLKNGQNWLLSEEISHFASSDFTFDKIELYLVSQRATSHFQKYIVDLSLQLTKNKKLLTEIKLTLLSEDSWNENIQTNK
ncbi:hypothetical protein [Lactococcus cremoris]|uniref:hypothetical protein n=1 Tax=Lactococcus lactis subsp. cremoris TaxID=1359 RepID=UPI0005B395D1|nr:hypothetical protein [Lactococcus cremoris]